MRSRHSCTGDAGVFLRQGISRKHQSSKLHYWEMKSEKRCLRERGMGFSSSVARMLVVTLPSCLYAFSWRIHSTQMRKLRIIPDGRNGVSTSATRYQLIVHSHCIKPHMKIHKFTTLCNHTPDVSNVQIWITFSFSGMAFLSLIFFFRTNKVTCILTTRPLHILNYPFLPPRHSSARPASRKGLLPSVDLNSSRHRSIPHLEPPPPRRQSTALTAHQIYRIVPQQAAVSRHRLPPPLLPFATQQWRNQHFDFDLKNIFF